MFKFHTTGVYDCSYLPGKQACSEVVTPEYQIDTQVYGKLIQAGFRRSGHYTYRPNCAHCRACRSVRVKVSDFSANRTQRRAWKRHQHLSAKLLTLHIILNTMRSISAIKYNAMRAVEWIMIAWSSTIIFCYKAMLTPN